MALRDLLNDALNSTPADDARRLATLRAVIEAADAQESATDADIHAIIGKIIAERELKAATFSTAGQADMAKAERTEIDALRTILRAEGVSQAPAAPKKVKPAAAAAPSKADPAAPLFTRTQMIIAAAAVVVLAIVAVLYFFVFNPGSDNPMLATTGASTPIQVYKDDRTLGSPKAPITLLEYAAPACPHCAHFNETVFPLLKKNYIDTGKVYYILRIFPIMPADGAAEAIARCLPADKYFWFIDLVFRNQKTWDPEYGVTDVRGGLLQVARIAGMSSEKVDQCIADKDEQDRINQVSQDGQLKYGLNAVPAFILDGTVWETGGVEWPKLKEKLDSMLSKH